MITKARTCRRYYVFKAGQDYISTKLTPPFTKNIADADKVNAYIPRLPLHVHASGDYRSLPDIIKFYETLTEVQIVPLVVKEEVDATYHIDAANIQRMRTWKK